VLEGLRQVLGFAYRPELFPFEVEYAELSESDRSEFDVGGARITTVPVDHTVATLGFRVDAAARSLSYSCDTLYAPAFVDLAAGSNFMIHEGFVTEEHTELSQRTKHATAREGGRAAREAGVGKLSLVHFFPPYEARFGDLVAEAREEFSGPDDVPEQLSVVEV
jgi:ribonuclease BN (tRNA processing enzyme)